MNRVPQRLTILAICLQEADEFGHTLESVLEPISNLELVRHNLPGDRLDESVALLSALINSLHPNLLLLCASNGHSANSALAIEALQKVCRELPIIAILDRNWSDDPQVFLDRGATDFCLAPLRLEDLLPRITRWALLMPGTNSVSRQLENTLGLRQFLGESPAFLEAINKIPKIAQCDATVFIAGETGTGKEMCARAIHHLGLRASHPFIPVNCGAIPSELVENELFGHHAGAFTGASSNARGLVHDAEGGTLFLDEVDSLPLQAQVKFLRFLQDQEYRPLGARQICQAHIRIIAASNTDLDGAVRSGAFRSDLFYRLNILPLRLPALRERREDIPLLARHFVAKYAKESSAPVKELSRTALEKLMAYPWPGNVRELENIIERAMILSEQPLIVGDDICLSSPSVSHDILSFKTLKAKAIAEFEASYIRDLLATNDGNISKAARDAKKNRRAFWELMRKYGITVSATATLHSEKSDKSLHALG